MCASSSDSTVRLRVTFLSLSNRKMWYPRMRPLATLLVSGSQASVTLVADVAAGVMFCGLPSGARTKFKRKGYVQYALLTYGNMPVQPLFRVKFLLKFKYENIVQLAFQKKFYSKTRMDGHITIREKSVLTVSKIQSITAGIIPALNVFPF